MMTKNVLIKPIDKCFTLKTLDMLHINSKSDSKSVNDPHPFPGMDIHNFQKVVRLL